MSEIDRENKRINDEIERQIRKDRMKSRRELKLLILGTGESGKTTFIKQMRIIHGAGYNDEEKKQFSKLIISNIYIAINTLINAMDSLNLSFKSKKAKSYAEKIRKVDFENFTYLEVI